MYCIYLLSSLWCLWNLKLKLSYQAIYLHNQKVRPKMKISQERKELLTWYKKHFSSFLKDFHWSKKTTFLVGQSLTLSNLYSKQIINNLETFIVLISVFSIWKLLQVLKKAFIKIMVHAIYTILYFLTYTLFCSAAK